MTPEETVNAFIAAVTGGDWDRAAELAAEDIVYENRGFAPTSLEEALPVVNGASAMIDFLGPMQDAEWIVHSELRLGNVVVNERTDKFTFGETKIELPVVGVFEVVDGRITLWRDYTNLTTMSTQLAGSPPE